MAAAEAPEPENPRPRAAIGIAAVIALIAGLVGIIAVTQPGAPTGTSPAAGSASTTIALHPGEQQLAFHRIELPGIPLVVARVSTGEITVVTGSLGADDRIRPGEVLVTADGEAWERLPLPFGEAAIVDEGAATPGGIALHGTDPGGASVLWLTEDARSWRAVVIDPEGDHAVTGVAASESVLLAWGQEDGWGRLDDALTERMGPAGRRYQLYDRADGGESEVLVQGPLGIAIARFTLEELGIDRAALEEVRQWAVASRDGANWDEATLPDDRFPVRPYAGADGRLYDIGPDGRVLATGNGRTWTETVRLDPPAAFVEPWNGWLSHGPEPLLHVSDDGTGWRVIDLRSFFEEPELWRIGTVAAGDAGIAVVAIQQGSIGETRPAEVETRRGEHLIRVTEATVDIEDAAAVLLASVPRTSVDPHPQVSFDPSAQEVTFRDASGSPLVTLTIEDLESIEDEYEDAATGTHHLDVTVLASPDGCSWTSQELGLEPGMTVHEAALIGSRLFLVTGGVFRPDRAGLWWAELPVASGACPLE